MGEKSNQILINLKASTHIDDIDKKVNVNQVRLSLYVTGCDQCNTSIVLSMKLTKALLNGSSREKRYRNG